LKWLATFGVEVCGAISARGFSSFAPHANADLVLRHTSCVPLIHLKITTALIVEDIDFFLIRLDSSMTREVKADEHSLSLFVEDMLYNDSYKISPK
jgi:hypothetical protein